MSCGGGATAAIRKPVCTIRAAGMIAVALFALAVCTARDAYAQFAPPTVTSVSPNSGPAAGGTSVTITGTSFIGTTAVTFGSTNATSFAVTGPTSITATSPAGSGTVDVRVTNPGGTSATSALICSPLLRHRP